MFRKVLVRIILVGVVLLGIASHAGVFLTSWVAGQAEAGSRLDPDRALSYGLRGPYPVGMRRLVMHEAPLETALWYPAAGRNQAPLAYSYAIKLLGGGAPLALATYEGSATLNADYDRSAAPYPLVILSPGFGIGATAYAWLAEHLASYGLVVLALDHGEQMDPALLWRATIDRPNDVLTVLASVDAHGLGPGLDGLIDPARLAAVGHSYGGYTALAAAGARMDTSRLATICEEAYRSGDPVVFLCDALLPQVPDMAAAARLPSVPDALWPAFADGRVDAVVALAGDAVMFGERGVAEIAAPVMAIGGTADRDSPFAWGTELAYEWASSSRKAEVALPGAEHMVFTGPCETTRRLLRMLPKPMCSDPAWSRTRAHEVVRHYTTAFLLAELRNDAAAAHALSADKARFSDVTYAAQGY